ncbi:serine/threonine protein phosphatase [Mesorhizobium microcysteis]|uniref:Serine/threonine protein phosphatase n=1 Tax=Neoaquamicrobium microcysteis TaxID=2682781 RepID=A0A5D4GQJ3_9HYPH|nr:metallophosphoesterase [Mesorhizobium microcysteis]TYR30598.1 serine/threonine protein phosphatase [Mesorhizobium microcysteis]
MRITRRIWPWRRQPRRERLHLDLEGTTVYAIGDIHGCYDELLALERRIVRDAAALDGPKLIVCLGDYVDRGPASRQVVEHLLQPPPEGFDRICLAGNHDVAMLDFIEGRLDLGDWMTLGAEKTLASYGIDVAYLDEIYRRPAQLDAFIRQSFPEAHVAFLRSLPVLAHSDKLVFVHAGIRPEVPLAEQKEDDLLMIGAGFLESLDLPDRWVVHGHTRVRQPQLASRRIGIDTACYATGVLTAVRIRATRVQFLFSRELGPSRKTPAAPDHPDSSLNTS